MTPEREQEIRRWVSPSESDLSYICPIAAVDAFPAISELLVALDAEREKHEEFYQGGYGDGFCDGKNEGMKGTATEK